MSADSPMLQRSKADPLVWAPMVGGEGRAWELRDNRERHRNPIATIAATDDGFTVWRHDHTARPVRDAVTCGSLDEAKRIGRSCPGCSSRPGHYTVTHSRCYVCHSRSAPSRDGLARMARLYTGPATVSP